MIIIAHPPHLLKGKPVPVYSSRLTPYAEIKAMPTKTITITTEQLSLYSSLFRGRTDVYARYWHNYQTGKSGYAPAHGSNQQLLPFTPAIFKGHLLGIELVGIYPLLPDSTTYFLAIDFDQAQWLDDAISVMEVTKNKGLTCYLERSKSGNGGHLWFFFEGSIPAWKARQLGKYLLSSVGPTTKKSFARFFPSQDEHTGKGFGSLVALPLHGKYRQQGNTVFIDIAGAAHPDQWKYLRSFQKITAQKVDNILAQAVIIPPPQKSVDVSDEENDEVSVHTNSTPHAKLILSNQIFIPSAFLPDRLYKFLKQRLNFLNPQFYELERRGYSTWKTPRYIRTIEITDTGIFTPAGFLPEIQHFALQHSIFLDIDDQQVLRTPIKIAGKITLKSEQQKITRELLKQNRTILEAPPGFGKTVVALYCLKRRRQPTLIVVHTKALLHQWRKAVEQWFNLNKKEIGIIGDNQWKLKYPITIASYQTLARRGIEEVVDMFGMVIVDECHHVPAHTFTKVIKNLPAKYILGLTATAFRKDKLEKLMMLYVGPIIQAKTTTDTVSQAPKEEAMPTRVHIRRTKFMVEKSIISNLHKISELLINNVTRNQQIMDNLIPALVLGKKCLVLTERVEHCNIFLKLIRQQTNGIHAAVITGTMGKKQRESIMKRLQHEKFQLLIATGKLIGEGFDWPELTHLFLAFPFSWKGKLMQYIGRVQRIHEDKQAAHVYDYTDYEILILRLMYFKRLRAYRELGLVRQPTKSINPVRDHRQIRLL